MFGTIYLFILFTSINVTTAAVLHKTVVSKVMRLKFNIQYLYCFGTNYNDIFTYMGEQKQNSSGLNCRIQVPEIFFQRYFIWRN